MRNNISSGGPFEDVYGYSRAVRVGDSVWVSGTCARGAALEGDAYAQTVDAIAILGDALTQAGASLGDVVRTVAYVTSIEDMPLVARAHAEAFGAIRPAATIVEVAKLADPKYLVELQVDAYVEAK